MSQPTIVIDKVVTNSVPPYSIVRYEFTDGVDPGSDSTSLISLELFALTSNQASYNTFPRTNLSAPAYTIELISFGISCLSTNYNFKFLNKDDISGIGTINEIAAYSAVNLSTSDIFSRFFIRNRDVVLSINLYLYVDNKSIIATGPITIELIYNSI